MNATTKDIARQTGFSLSTVTKVVRGLSRQYNIKPETEKLIMGAAAELNYRPNHAARALITRKTNTVGLLFHSVKDQAQADRMFAIQEYLNELGYVGIISNWAVGERSFQTACDSVISRGVDGIICSHFETQLLTAKPPVVLLAYEDERFDSINYDYQGIIDQACDYFRSQGHKRIGFVGARTNERRYHAFMKQVQNDPTYTYCTQDGLHIGQAAVEYFLSLKHPPTALLCFNDISAMRLISAATSRGWKVPEQLSVIGMDNLPDAEVFWPTLTTFNSRINETSKILVDILMERIHNPEAPLKKIIMDWPLIIRNSTGPCPKGKVMK